LIAPTEKLLTPHWIARLFGGSSATFTLSANGITVCKDNGETFTVLAESFLQDGRLSKGLFLCKLLICMYVNIIDRATNQVVGGSTPS